MKVAYDSRSDTVVMILKGDTAIAESEEVRPGIVFDLDGDGQVVSIEILDASRRVSSADRMEFVTD